jgi:hypothetical protein
MADDERGDTERERRIELLKTQIDQDRLNHQEFMRQLRWEPYKALAAILGAAAAMLGITLALAIWLAPHLK